MSVFKTVLEKENSELAQRWQLLADRAEALGIDLTLPDTIKEDTLKNFIKNGITEENLNELEAYLIKEEVRHELGINQEFHIDSVDKLDWYLQKRLHYYSELEAVKVQYDKLKQSIESQLSKLDSLYNEEAEIYTKSEYERTGKKTIIRPYGTIQFRDEKPSWKIEDEKALQRWLASLTDEERQEYKCKPKTWDRDLEAIKKRAEIIRQKHGLESVIGLTWNKGGLTFKLQLPKEKE